MKQTRIHNLGWGNLNWLLLEILLTIEAIWVSNNSTKPTMLFWPHAIKCISIYIWAMPHHIMNLATYVLWGEHVHVDLVYHHVLWATQDKHIGQRAYYVLTILSTGLTHELHQYSSSHYFRLYRPFVFKL